MKQFAAFVLAAFVWTAAAGLLLHVERVQPLAIFVVWLIGFVWIAGYFGSGQRDADHLVKVWLGMLAGFVVFAGIGVAILS